MESNQSSDINPHTYMDTWLSTKKPNLYKGKTYASPTNVSDLTRCQNVVNANRSISTTLYKSQVEAGQRPQHPSKPDRSKSGEEPLNVLEQKPTS